MENPPLPANESLRLEALREYNILDSLSEKDYEDITLLAATICKTPISLITFIDKDRQWFKSHYGVSVSETKREYAFCAHALNSPHEALIVEDARKDKRFAVNPLVTGDPYVVFYTGMPLVTPGGYALGTLCVVDHQPRKLAGEQLSALEIRQGKLQAIDNIARAVDIFNGELNQCHGNLKANSESLAKKFISLSEFISIRDFIDGLATGKILPSGYDYFETKLPDFVEKIEAGVNEIKKNNFAKIMGC